VDLTDKLRFRLAASLMARGDFKAALAHYDALSRTPENPFAAQAHYRAGECLIRQGDREGAIKRLLPFRDQEALQNLSGTSDPALARLGHVFAQLKQWEQSRQAHAQLLSRFPDSPWVAEARLGLGWSWQSQKDYAKALEMYAQVPLDPPTEAAARARLLIGLCQLEQKKHAEALASFLAVPAHHDLPDLCAFAFVEAAHAASPAKQPELAEKLLHRATLVYPKSAWAQVARERLKKASETPPHDLPAAVALLVLEAQALPPLEAFGQKQDTRASLPEAVEQLDQALILLRKPPRPTRLAPYVRLAPPDPFEHRGIISLRIDQAEERLP
jgi:TolA-binding protein